MNKILRYSLMAIMAMVFGNVMADDVTDVLTWDKLLESGKGNTYTEFSGKTVTSAAVYAGKMSSGSDSYIQLRTSDSSAGIVTTTSGGKLKSVTITFNAKTSDRAIEIYGKNEAYTASTDLYNSDTKGQLLKVIGSADESKTLTVEGDYTFVGIKSASGAIYVDKIEITWTTGGAPVVTVAAPTIDGLTPFYGSTEVTITNNEEGAKVYYTTDGNDPTASSPEYTTAFSITETTTVKAIAIKGETSSTVASKTFTAVPAVENIAALNALENGSVFAFTGEPLVVYVSGKYAYIKDETGSSLIYSNDAAKLANLEKGKKVAANWTGKVSIYKNLFEAVPDATLDVVAGDPVVVNYPEAAMGDVIAANMNQVVVIKGVNYTAPDGKNFNITKGDAVVKGYNQFSLEIAAPEESKTYDITGVISVYNDDVQFQPIAIAEAGGTGINTINAAKVENAVRYNLAGQKVDNSFKGVVIVNGKKMLQK